MYFGGGENTKVLLRFSLFKKLVQKCPQNCESKTHKLLDQRRNRRPDRTLFWKNKIGGIARPEQNINDKIAAVQMGDK